MKEDHACEMMGDNVGDARNDGRTKDRKLHKKWLEIVLKKAKKDMQEITGELTLTDKKKLCHNKMKDIPQQIKMSVLWEKLC